MTHGAADSPAVSSSLPPHTALVLIHGTFASDSPWAIDNSDFVKLLKSHLGNIPIHRFRWSGANSHAARTTAAKLLVDFTRTICTQHGYDKVWFIAHSHGGNVVNYASKYDSFRDVSAGIIYYGTPFLNIYPRNIERFVRVVTQTLSWLILFPVILPLGALAITNAASFLFGPIGWALAFYGLGPLLVLGYLGIRPMLRDYICQRTLSTLQKRQRKLILQLFQPPPACPTYVITVPYDEAVLLLGFFDRVSLAPWFGFSIASRSLLAMLVSFLSANLFAALNDDTLDELQIGEPIFQAIMAIMVFIVLGPPFIAVFVAAVRGHLAAFGWEGFSAATVRIIPARFPTWSQMPGSARAEFFPQAKLLACDTPFSTRMIP